MNLKLEVIDYICFICNVPASFISLNDGSFGVGLSSVSQEKCQPTTYCYLDDIITYHRSETTGEIGIRKLDILESKVIGIPLFVLCGISSFVACGDLNPG